MHRNILVLKQYNLRLEALDKIYRGIISAQSVEEIVNETINQLQKLSKEDLLNQRYERLMSFGEFQK